MPDYPLPHERVIARRQQIGDHIRDARVARNLTQEVVAHRAEMTLGPYNRIEKGHAAARIDTLISIAHAIGVPLSYLVREPEQPST